MGFKEPKAAPSTEEAAIGRPLNHSHRIEPYLKGQGRRGSEFETERL